MWTMMMVAVVMMMMMMMMLMNKKRKKRKKKIHSLYTCIDPWHLTPREFHTAQSKDAWNVGTSDLEQAVLCLERSPKLPSVPDLICILQKCRRMKHPSCAQRLKMYMESKDLERQTVLGNYLVSMLADCGHLSDAEGVMERLEFRNVYSWNALISSYVDSGKVDRVIDLYKKMQSDGLHPTTYTFVALLKACSMQKNLEMGRALREEILNMGLEDSIFVGNALIDMFGKCGSLAESQEVFDSLSARDVVSWSSMLSAYVGLGYYENAINCFSQMMSQGGLPNVVTYMISLQACYNIRAIEAGFRIYGDILKRGFDADICIGNTCLAMFCKCGCLDEAQLVFDKLPMHDIVSWNVLMSGYIECGYGKEALHCFGKMHSENALHDDVAVVCGLKACGSTRSIDLGRSIYAGIVKRGLDHNSLVGNTLVDMFGKCGFLEEAQQVFNRLSSLENASWSSLIMAYAQHGRPEEALNCLHQMRLQCASPDDVLLACSLKACRSSSSISKGREMHGEITKYGLEKDCIIGSALVDMYGECGVLLEARKVFDELPVWNIKTWSSIIKGCGINQEGNMAMQYFKDMQEKGIKPDPIAFTTVLVACSQTSLVSQGQECISMVEMRGLQTLYQISCMVDLLARSGCVDAAVGILDTVESPPPKETWKSLLTACKAYGYVDLGSRCLRHLIALDPEDGSSYAMMADIYRNAEKA